MLIRILSFILFLVLAARANAQITDAQNLTKDIKALMYSDPEKALKTAQYILSNQSFGTTDDVYNACLLQAEIYIDQKKYNDAILRLIVADRLSSKVNDDFLLAKNEYLISKLYLELGFEDNFNYAINDFDKVTGSLKGEQKNGAELWKNELLILQAFYKKDNRKSLELIQKNINKKSELDSKYQLRLDIIRSEIQNVPLAGIDAKENAYFKFLSDLVLLKSKLKKNQFAEAELAAIKKQNPQYSDVFYKDFYREWSQQVCDGKHPEDCFRTRKEYIKILKLSIGDIQNARVNVINLIDQKERQRNLEQKEFQNKILFTLFAIAFLLLVAYLIYYFVLRNKANMANAEFEKQNIYKEYEQKLSDQLKDFQASNAFSIPEKTENMILSKLEIFEGSKEVTNPHLSLAVLAKRLDTNSKYLSEIINKHKQKNFNNYLNELRVKYIISKLQQNPEYLQYKTSYLAEEAGFASRTTFTTIFKNIAGKSPSQFIDELKNQQE